MYYQTRFFLLGCILLAPFTAKPATITVNNVCEVNCSAPDTLTNDTSTDGSFGFVFAFGDGDSYDVSGDYSASYSSGDGSTIAVTPIVTYLGSAPSVANDTIDFALFQNYFDTSCCSWAGTYTETVPLSLSALAGPGSSVSGQLFFDGQGIGLVGPYGPGTYLQTVSAPMDFGALDTNPSLSAEFDFSFVFGAGTQPGVSASASTVPEPVTAIPSGLGLILIGLARRRRNR
jgi:hypothetical protein